MLCVSIACYSFLGVGIETYSVKNVALGSGFTITACCHIMVATLSLKFSAVVKAETAFSKVIFPPSCGRKLWFANVFIIGQGPRKSSTPPGAQCRENLKIEAGLSGVWHLLRQMAA